MKSFSLQFASLIVIIVLVIGGAIAYRLATSRSGSSSRTESICETCFPGEPVGDVIIPTLSQGVGGGYANRSLNLTQGENTTLGVNVYLTISANVSMGFKIESSPSSATTNSAAILYLFTPEAFHAETNRNASTILNLSVSKDATTGSYSALVTVSDIDNASNSWGTLVQLNIAAS
jgi:hypothetical protein